jgi:hypothetical protein
MNRSIFQCACCGRHLPRDPRVKNQQYCGRKKCQQARKNRWQRLKLQTDPDYRADKIDSGREWRLKNKGYSKQYRLNHPSYVERNRVLQRKRDQQRNCMRSASPDAAPAATDLAKKDALVSFLDDNSMRYFLFPVSESLAKKDALMVKIVPITPG